MVNKITFQFNDKLEYQLQAVSSIVELFRGLPQKVGGIYENVTRIKKLAESDPVRNIPITTGARLLNNLNEVQLRNNLFTDNELYDNNFTIEMETGTGKTYVYLRTILELHQEYDFKKFMIIVPSIAIRQGVWKSIEMLSEHFKTLYNIDLIKHSFIYESKNPKNVSSKLVETNDLSICVMNIQAFNKDSNIIRSEDEYGQILWDDIKYIRPIVIIDEPQKIEGSKKKKSASLKAIEDINPLFTLRYSATHKQLYNQVYKLDSYAAYKQNLVKHIEVKTVNGLIPKEHAYIRYLDFTSDLFARIEMFSQKQGQSIKFEAFKVRGNASLYDLSGGLPQYQNMRIYEDPHKLRPLKIAEKDNIIELIVGRSTYEITANEAVRIQIRLAISSHFQKQSRIFKKGKKIKVLTLFFVDSVSKVRDNSREDRRGEYLRIFDDEIEKYLAGQKIEKMFEKTPLQLSILNAATNTKLLREGYFAIDKSLNEVEIDDWDSSISDDEINIKMKSQEDIDRGIELILEKKDELISFDEPLSFIFSHSALREGWDNPNVFTICTLKNGGSDIAKKQEIGRGLRLPVDIYGVRSVDPNINELTVIANDNYNHFAEALQKDFNESMNFKKDEVTSDILTNTLKNAGIPVDKITPKLVQTFKEELFFHGIIDANNMLKKDANQILYNIDFQDDILKEHSFVITDVFTKYMLDKGTKKIDIRNGDNEPVVNEVQTYVSEDTFKKIFSSLAQKLSMRTIYKLDLNKDEFISECINEINNLLLYSRVKNQYEISRGKVETEESGRIVVGDGKTQIINSYAQDELQLKSDFELMNYIMYHTNLPRFAILKILWGIEKKILLSNQDILDLVTKKIIYKFSEAKANSIHSYEVIEGYEFETQTIFAADSISEEMLNEAKKVYQTNPSREKGLNKFYRTDSDGEYDFAECLDEDPNVLLFTKLKKGGFVIDTPYNNYSPDWAIAYKKEDGNVKLYFVVETKPGKELKDLSVVEQVKIKCGYLHFQAVSKASPEIIKFNWANSYEDFKEKFGLQ